jgi:hypothetical protein
MAVDNLGKGSISDGTNQSLRSIHNVELVHSIQIGLSTIVTKHLLCLQNNNSRLEIGFVHLDQTRLPVLDVTLAIIKDEVSDEVRGPIAMVVNTDVGHCKICGKFFAKKDLLMTQ